MEHVKAEPVAWLYELPDGECCLVSKRDTWSHDCDDGWTETPLYATPQPAAVDALVRALRPFALVAEHDIGEDESDFDLFKSLSYNHAPRITVGDIRRAHQALTKIKQS